MKRIERYFQGIDIGTCCTGTVAYFGIRVGPLIEAGIVSIEQVRYGATSVDEYVFKGFPENEEHLQNAPGA